MRRLAPYRSPRSIGTRECRRRGGGRPRQVASSRDRSDPCRGEATLVASRRRFNRMPQLMLRAGFRLSVGILAVLSLSLVPVSSRAQTSGGSGLPGLTDALLHTPPATGPFAYNS